MKKIILFTLILLCFIKNMHSGKVEDYLVKATAYDGRVLAYGALTTNTVEEIRKKQETLPTSTVALGQTVSAGAMMGSMLNNKGNIKIEVDGNGPIGKITVNSDSNLVVSSSLEHPEADVFLKNKGEVDVSSIVGDGVIHIVKDDGEQEATVIESPIISNGLAESFTYYFAYKEKIPAAVSLGVLVNGDLSVRSSGGIIIHISSDLKDDEITVIENNLDKLPKMSTLLDQGLSVEEILEMVLGNIDVIERKKIGVK